MAQLKDLHEFLVGAELQHYYNNFVKDLKVTTVSQIKYVDDNDLLDFGMSKPEIRRLRRLFSKEHPKGALGKLKKILTKYPSDASPASPPSVHGQQLQLPCKSSSKHIIPEDAITVHKMIGNGEFGVVHQGVWTGEMGEQIMVAVKCLPREKLRAQMSDFLQEATIMHSLDHPRIVQLFGVVLSSDNLMLVTELAPLRSLLECLRESSLRCSFCVSILCELAIQVTDGMSYLESRRLIHRDLATRNVLMFAKDKIKISDFGLSRALGMEKDYYQSTDGSTKLPIAWCAPECINFLKFTSASDVWSFGVTLWEMFSYGAQPWEGLNGEEIIQNIDEPLCRHLMQPDHCPDEWFALMLKCWLIEPNDRPKFIDLLSMLQQIRPARVIATADISNDDYDSSYLYFKANDVVTVLSKMPDNVPRSGLWKGLLDTVSQPGYFDPIHFSPVLEVTTGPILRKTKIIHSGSTRISSKGARKLTPSMISNPQNDLRHIGHVGYDGAVFGDVSFIGDNYDKLPIKVGNTRKSCEDVRDMSASYPGPGESTAFSAIGSAVSSVVISGDDWLTSSESNNFDDFADFKLPDFSSDFDLGSSLMDEVMKAFGSTSDNNSEFLLSDLKSISNEKTNSASISIANTQDVNIMENEDTDQDEEDEDEEDEEDEEEDEVDEEEDGMPKQSNNSLFGSSSCSSSRDPLDDYNGLRKTDESSSDRRYQSSNYDRSSSEKSYDEDGTTNRSNEKILSPLSLGSCASFEKEDKVLTVIEPRDLSSDSSNALLVVSSDQSVKAENEGDTKALQKKSLDVKICPSTNGESSKSLLPESGRHSSDTALISIAEASAQPAANASNGNFQGTVGRIVRPLNQNIRAPQGIPGWEIPSRKPFINPGSVGAPSGEEEIDTNPLRRLRDSQAGFGRPTMTFRPVGSSGRVIITSNISPDDSNQNNLNVNLSFFDKLKEQELQ